MLIYRLDVLGDIIGGIITAMVEAVLKAIFSAFIPEVIRSFFEGAAAIIARVFLFTVLGCALCALVVCGFLIARRVSRRKARRRSASEMREKNPNHRGPTEAEIRQMSFADIRRIAALVRDVSSGSAAPEEPAPEALRTLYGFETMQDVYDVLPAIGAEAKARGSYPP